MAAQVEAAVQFLQRLFQAGLETHQAQHHLKATTAVLGLRLLIMAVVAVVAQALLVAMAHLVQMQ
jgi:hypothetical protein